MRWLHTLRVRTRSLFSRGRVERQLDAELRFHVEQQTEENLRAGMNPDAARLAALRATGSITRIKEQCRESLGLRLLDELRQDLRYAIRRMRKNPGFAGVVVLTLALGIGANTTIFTLLDAVVLKPLAVPAASELIALHENGSEGVADASGGTGRYLRFSYPRFQRLSVALGSHGTLAAVTRSSPFVLRGTSATPRTRIAGQLVSGGYFSTLRVLAARGRLIADDDVRAASPVAVISDTFWRRAMQASDSAIGETLVVNGLSVTVVGIAERGFVGMWTDSEADVWMPLTLQPALGYQTNSSSWGGNLNDPWPPEDRIAWLNLVGRVSPDGIAEASALLQAANHLGILDAAAGLDPRDSMRGHTLVIEPFARGFSGLRARYTDALLALTALVMIVLLVTCSSVANLLLARAAASARESGIRTALGATAGRLVRQGLTESLLLAFAGGAIGLFAGEWSSGFLARQVLGGVNNLPHVFSPDARVLTFTAITALFTVLVFGLAPAVRAMRVGRQAAPGSSQRGAIDRSAMKGMRPLVALQVALSVVVVFAALLLGRTLINFTRIDPGFSNQLVAATFDPMASGYSAARVRGLDQSLVSAVGSVRGVTGVAVSRCGLVAGCSSSGSYRFDGQDSGGDSYYRNWVGPGYFGIVGIPVVAGREFDERDATGSPVAVISESVARRFFAGEDPIGKRMGSGALDTEIVGVVRDARSMTVHNPPVPMVYQPMHAKSDTGMRGYYMEARVSGDPAALLAPVRDAVQRAEPSLLTNDMTTMPARLSRDTGRERVVAYLASSFAALTLLLAALGIYGVLAYDVARRTKEIGVRMALGAQRVEVTKLILGHGLGLTIAGVTIGLAGAAAVARYLQGMLFGVSALGPSSFVLVPLVFVSVAAVASYVPARRATRVDPLEALRCE